MNRDKLDEIRQLIELWYDGQTDHEQEARIERFFKQTDNSQLPDDLKAEAEVFGCMSVLAQQCPDTEFVEEIEAAVQSEARRPRLMRRVIVWTTSVASAAAIVIAIGVGLKMKTVSLDTAPVADPLPTTTVASVADEKSPSANQTEEIAIQPVHEVVASPTSLEQPVAKSQVDNRPAEQQDVVSDEYTEITDPEQVLQIIRRVYNQSTELFSQSAKSIAEVEQSVQRTTINTINTIKSTNLL